MKYAVCVIQKDLFNNNVPFGIADYPSRKKAEEVIQILQAYYPNSTYVIEEYKKEVS